MVNQIVNLVGDNKTFKLAKNTTYTISGTNDIINAALNNVITITNTGTKKNTLNLQDFTTVTLVSGQFTVKNAGTGYDVLNLKDNVNVTLESGLFNIVAPAAGNNIVSGFTQADKLDLSATKIHSSGSLHISYGLETGDVIFTYNVGRSHLTLASLGQLPAQITYAPIVLSTNVINYSFKDGGGYNIIAARNNGIEIGAGTGKVEGDKDTITKMVQGYVTLADNSYLQVDGSGYQLNTNAGASFVATGSNTNILARGSITYAEIAGSSTVTLGNKRAGNSTFKVDASSSVTFNNKLNLREAISLGGDDQITLNGSNFKVLSGGLNNTISGFVANDYLDVSSLGYTDYASLQKHTRVGIIDYADGSSVFTQIDDKYGSSALHLNDFDFGSLDPKNITFAPLVGAK